jgi:hypothetical protein
LLEDNCDNSGERVMRLKRFIASKYLTCLPGYGTVILRSKKTDFLVAVKALERYVLRFQRMLKRKLQAAIDANRELLVAALLPSVAKSPPARWERFLSNHRSNQEITLMLRSELTNAFGNSNDVFQGMEVRLIFKGVTYESLSDPKFIQVASRENSNA